MLLNATEQYLTKFYNYLKSGKTAKKWQKSGKKGGESSYFNFQQDPP